MPPYRSETGRLNQPQLRPTANPVDTFVRPTGEGDDLRQLADALGGLSSGLRDLTEQRKQEHAQRGRTDATSLYEEVKATGKKIKSGEIAPHESRWYRAAAREQVGRLMAQAYGQDLLLATQSDEALKESTDPQDFDQFEAQARSKWLEEKVEGDVDPAFMAGFNAISGQGILNARGSFVAAAANRLDGQVLDNTYTEDQVAIRSLLQSGATFEQMAADIAARHSKLYIANPKLGKALNRTAIEAVLDAADAYESPEMIRGILNNMPGGTPGSSLGLTREALSKITEAERRIRVNRQNRLASEEKDEKRKRREIIDDIYVKAMETLEANPEADVSGLVTELMAVDRAEAPKLFRIAKAFKSAAAPVDDEVVKNGLFQSLFDAELTGDRIADAFEDGKLTSKTALTLFTQLRASRGRQTLKALVQDPVFVRYSGLLKTKFEKLYGQTPGGRDESALMQLDQEWVRFRQSPEGAALGEQETLDWLRQAVDRNFARFAGADLKELDIESPKPDAPGAGPSLPKWESELVSPTLDIDKFAQEWQDLKDKKRSTLSDAHWAIIHRHGLKGPEIDRFIQAQRTARSLSKKK